MNENQDRSQNQETPPTGPGIPQMTPAAEEETHRKTSGMAVASLVLGILGFVTCGTTGIFGLVLGIIALVQISRSPRTLSGNGMAVAGVVTGAIALFTMPIMAAIMFPVFVKARESARITRCMENVIQINISMQMYANDWDKRFPPSSQWNEALSTYSIDKKVLRCPSDKSPGPSYAMNKLLSNSSISDIVSPVDTVLVFESASGVNLSGGEELLLKEPRHRDFEIMGFADGHVDRVPPDEIDSLAWDPAKSVEQKQPDQSLPVEDLP